MISMIAAITELLFFFLSDHSDRSDHMETRLKVETVALGNKIGRSYLTLIRYSFIEWNNMI